MLKVVFFSLLGLMVSSSGIYLIYLYLGSLNATGKPLYIAAALPAMILGIWLLVRANGSNELVVNEEKPLVGLPDSPVPEKFENAIQKNNQTVEEWIKESEKRDKMKILQIAAAAEEQSEQDSKTKF